MKLYTDKMRYLLLFLLVFVFSCRSPYLAFVHNYRFAPPSAFPQYNHPDYWAAHPWKKDPSDSLPAALKNQINDSLVDVFFIHPTTYTGKKESANADISDAALAAKTDYSTILYQASVFNQHARIFAPRYRQAHLSQFFIPVKESKPAFDTAYADVKRAFAYYLAHYHHDRPLIIAAHSQGALLAEWLLKEFFDGKPLQQKLVAAYIIGWPVAQNYFATIPVCSEPGQTGCFCSWRTFRQDYMPAYVEKEAPPAVVTNPLSWKTTGEYIGREQNKGSVLRNFSEVVAATTDAQIHGGVLWVNRPKFRGSIFFLTRNYHIADINLFYMNIRENVEQRIFAYLKEHRSNASILTTPSLPPTHPQ